MCNDTTYKLMKLMTTDPNSYRPLWLPALTRGAPDIFDGDPVWINQDMADGASAKALIYGDLSKYLIRDVMGVEVTRLVERYAEYRQIGFMATARADGDLLDAGTDPVKYGTNAAS